MKGRVRAFLGQRSRRHHCLTAAEIAESDRLRETVLRAGLGEIQLAGAARCTRATIRGWIERHRHLAPTHQAGIRGTFSSETGGPG
jgi:hypothetical protein